MRTTILLRSILCIDPTCVVGAQFQPEHLEIRVCPSSHCPRCSGCYRKAPSHDRHLRTWRHLDVAGMKVVLSYAFSCVDCPYCGVRAELVPWAEPGSRFTRYAEAKETSFDYIEIFYNQRRRRAFNGYLSPAEAERRYGELQIVSVAA